jgi:lysophospholipase L1-like esterase
MKVPEADVSLNKHTYVFIGDSVTDCDRRERPDGPLGNGYVRFLSEQFAAGGEEIDVLNRGISGDRVRDLRARWEADCLDLQPTLVSIAVGINDTWRRYDSGDPTTAEDFEDDYRSLLFPLRVANVAMVLVEPFLLPISDEQRMWREDLDPKIQIVRGLAGEFGATLVPTDALLAAAAEEAGVEAIALDGVHPTTRGHQLLARAWGDAQPQSES